MKYVSQSGVVSNQKNNRALVARCILKGSGCVYKRLFRTLGICFFSCARDKIISRARIQKNLVFFCKNQKTCADPVAAWESIGARSGEAHRRTTEA